MAVKETAENCRKKEKLDSTKLKNLLKQKFNPKRPDAVWCTDITYIWTSEGFMYLSTIMDLFSHNIIAWELSRTMEEEFVIKTVEKAKTERKIKRPLIIHSDRGSHYERIHSHCGFTSPNEYEVQFKNKNSAMRYKKAASRRICSFTIEEQRERISLSISASFINACFFSSLSGATIKFTAPLIV